MEKIVRVLKEIDAELHEIDDKFDNSSSDLYISTPASTYSMRCIQVVDLEKNYNTLKIMPFKMINSLILRGMYVCNGFLLMMYHIYIIPFLYIMYIYL